MTDRELSQTTKDQAGGLMSRFNPLNLARGIFGRKKPGEKAGDMMGTDRQKLKAAVSKGKDPEFTTLSASDTAPVRRGDSVANVAAKIYNMMNRKFIERRTELKIESKFLKQLNETKETRHKELVEALTTAREKSKEKPPEVKKPKKEDEKEAASATEKPSAKKTEEPKIKPKLPKTKAKEPKAKEPKAKEPKAKEPKAGQPAPKPTPKKAPAKPPTAVAAPKPVKPVTAPAPKVPPSAVPPVTPTVSTATKLGAGAILSTAGSAAFAAGPLAENIVSHESKVSSPLRKEGKKIETKWKNGTEYNAYNKGTTIPADFDEKGESLIDFSKMTIEEYLERGSIKNSKNPKKIFAMGRYQIIPDTMRLLVKELKIDPKTTYLTPETQDYLFTAGLIGKKRKKVKDYIDGDPKVSRDEAILELAKEFASIGVPYDVKYKGMIVKKGQSFYGQNVKSTGMALNPPETVGKALDAEREKNLSQQKNKPVSVPEKGKELDTKSLENKELKKVSSVSGTTILNMNNTTIAATTSSNQTMVTPKSDASRFVQGVTA